MGYIEIDYKDVVGYGRLSEPAKNAFERIYKVHNASHGNDFKKDWIPIRVKEYRDYIKVYFKNGEWLHYFPDGTWS